MKRITISEINEFGETERLGYFDLDAATHILEEDTFWDGNNMRGKVSGLQTTRADLYRTAGGRWVEHRDASHEFNGPNRWTFFTDDEAREWMLKSGGTEAEAALEKWFPDTPDESGPGPQGGRPAIDGPPINVQYPRELLDRIDAACKAAKLSRAEWLRQAAEKALA